MRRMTESPRRGFLKALGSVAAALTTLPSLSRDAFAAPLQTQGTPARRAGARYMGDYAAPKLDKVRVALIGVGARGSSHTTQLSTIEGTEVVGISDLYQDLAQRAEKSAVSKGHAPKLYYGSDNAWRTMLTETKPDAVFIATPWQLHAPMGVAAMRAGAHAFIEIPIAITLQEMWELVDTSEQTGRHCMLMENVCYGREELLYLNMVRKGLLGELLHAEAAYIHDLREQMKEVARGTGSWRTYHYAQRKGNLYPCHGLGPVAQYMSLARTDDHFGRLSSFSSPGRGRTLYGKANFPADHKWNALDFSKGGDMNTSIVKTMQGRTIMIQWDETSPRPYTRHNLIQGTRGTLAGFPNRLSIEGVNRAHQWAQGEEFQKITAEYEHPLWKRAGELAAKMGGHGGMDFLMLYRIVECLRTGQPLDQNVYEGCSWSAVAPLSEKSVRENGAPQDFPDFTRGGWKTTKALGVVG
jgi:predicted dehydrogenase